MPRALSDRAQEILAMYPPFLRRERHFTALAAAQAPELEALEAAIDGVRSDAFPQLTSDPRLWEAVLGIPSNPALSLDVRRANLIAALARVLSTGSGAEWEAQMTQLFGGGWSYKEWPDSEAPFVLDVEVPFLLDSPQAVLGMALARAITPANCEINFAYSGGFIVGRSQLGDPL